MTPALQASARHGIGGTVLAVAGVAVARLVAPDFAGSTRAILLLTGQLVALGGLLIIILGIRRRVNRSPAETTR